MANYINPNQCNQIDCYLVFNNTAGSNSYSVPTLTLGQLTLYDGTRKFQVCWDDILCGGNGAKELCPTSGTAQRNTITIVTAPGSTCCGNFITYDVTFSWDVSCGEYQNLDVEVVGTVDAGDTTTTVATKLAASITTLINNGALPLASATAVGNVVTVIAIAAGVSINVAVGSSASGGMTTAVTVPNVNPFGRVADLTAMGVPSTLLDASGSYIGVAISYWFKEDAATPQMNVGSNANINAKVLKQKTCWVFVESGGEAQADILTNDGALQDILSMTLVGGLTAANYLAKQTVFCIS